jgi:hypothetical protein
MQGGQQIALLPFLKTGVWCRSCKRLLEYAQLDEQERTLGQSSIG